MTSPTLLPLLGDLVRVETRLYNALNERLRERHGIVASQWEFLRGIRDGSDRVADLAERFAIGVGGASKGVDRLERAGWVARKANPGDRRSSLLVLTTEGRALAAAADSTAAALLAELVGDALPPDRLAALAEDLADLRSALERDGVGRPVG